MDKSPPPKKTTTKKGKATPSPRKGASKKSTRKRRGGNANNTVSTHTTTTRQGSNEGTKTVETNNKGWNYDEGAKMFVKNNTLDLSTIRSEFSLDSTIRPSPQDCLAFYQHLKKNRQPQALLSETTRIKIQNPSGAYFNAAKISNLAEPNRTILIGQVPDQQDLEMFWRMIYDEGITSLFISTSSKIVLNGYIPVALGAFAQIGKMLLSNKKVDILGKEILCMTIELLPDGCSNSNLVQVYHIQNWAQFKIPNNLTDLIVICEKMLMKSSDGIMFCSWFGLGRSGILLMIYCIMSHISKNIECKVPDLFSKLRGQRFGIVENVDQYVAIYQSICCWIRANSKDSDILKAIEAIPQPPSS
ncbi:unnamed protein product [Caenorhabditis angaria]|uniref:Tyrosine-protein phosphatase domain-containing protein n=1 Tax=Caenorhabditis angaria TaxID=860376 RepID=A0A9P1I7J4_9PELO|nr:unnamed protein product [Caenorhabditis angaria]